jgi:hypothetical protein
MANRPSPHHVYDQKEPTPSQAQNKPSKIMTQASYVASVRTFKCHPTHVKKPWHPKVKTYNTIVPFGSGTALSSWNNFFSFFTASLCPRYSPGFITVCLMHIRAKELSDFVKGKYG